MDSDKNILVFRDKHFWQIGQISKWISTPCYCVYQLFDEVHIILQLLEILNNPYLLNLNCEKS